MFFPPTTLGSDATGSIRFASCSLSETYRLELVSFQKKKLEKVLVLTLPTDGFLRNLENEKDWIEVPGEECARSGQCRFVMKSKVQILHVSFFSKLRSVSAISGNFQVSFSDGRKLEGSFGAKGIKPGTEIICE